MRREREERTETERQRLTDRGEQIEKAMTETE